MWLSRSDSKVCPSRAYTYGVVFIIENYIDCISGIAIRRCLISEQTLSQRAGHTSLLE